MNIKFWKQNRGAASVAPLGLSFAVLLFSANLFAQFSDKESVITFSAPFEISGTNPQVLPAGTYRFRLVDSKSDSHIVQISNREDSHVYSTILAIPAHRDLATNDTVMTFQERGFGQPEALQTWFYSRDKNGEEFVYPPAKPAPQVARTSPVTEAPAPAPAVVVPPQPEIAVNTPPAAAPEPPARVEATPAPATAEAEPPAAAAPPQEPPQLPAALPHTASTMPLLALVGILFIGFGLAVGQLRKR